MSLSNIDDFNISAGKILAKLYETFPVPMNILPEHFVEGGRDACYKFDEFLGAESHNSTAINFLCVAAWLIQEQYVAATDPNRHMGYFKDAVLTQKGLLVLDTIPKSLEYTAPIGERLVKSVKTGAGEAVKSIAREALQIGIKTISGP